MLSVKYIVNTVLLDGFDNIFVWLICVISGAHLQQGFHDQPEKLIAVEHRGPTI